MMKCAICRRLPGIAVCLLGIVLFGCGGSGGVSTPHSAVLSWSAPATRVNGDRIAMGELDRYVIRYGRNPKEPTGKIVIGGAASAPEMSYTIRNLQPGTWYFTIQVQDTAGLLSEPSEPVSKTFQP